MKKWPDKGTVRYNELIDPLKKLLKIVIKNSDDVYINGLGYEGYDIGNQDKGTILPPDLLFSKEHLQCDLEKSGIDVYDNIIMIIFALGTEQGRRQVMEELDVIRGAIGMLKKDISQVETMFKLLKL